MHHIDTWIAEENAILDLVNKGKGAGTADSSLPFEMTGLEIMQGMLRGEVPIPPFAATVTFGAISVAHGSAVFQGTPHTSYLNPMGTVHGGWVSTLLDSAMGSAALTVLPRGYSYVTKKLNVNYVRALTTTVRRVRAEAKVTEQTKRTALAYASLVGPDNTVYATAEAEFRLFAIPQPEGDSQQRALPPADQLITSSGAM